MAHLISGVLALGSGAPKNYNRRWNVLCLDIQWHFRSFTVIIPSEAGNRTVQTLWTFMLMESIFETPNIG